jgi:hypothetical protein
MSVDTDTIETEASQIASDPRTLSRFLAVHHAVLLLIDNPHSPSEAMGDMLAAEYNGGTPL